MKRFLIFVLLLIAFPVFAGEKEDLQKDAQLYQQQLTILNQQMQLIQLQYPQIEAKLNEVKAKLTALESAKKDKLKKAAEEATKKEGKK